MEDTNGQPLSIGSGFFVRNGQIATNLHVIEGAARGYAKLVGQKTKYDIEGIIAIDPQRDLVILKVAALDLQVLSLGDVDVVQFQGLIPAGLAKRIESNIHPSVQKLTARSGSKTPQTKVELRILDFEIVE